MRIRHENALARHEVDINTLQNETAALRATLMSLDNRMLEIRKSVFAIIADLQSSLERATDKLGEVALALTKSDDTIRAMAGKQ